MDIKTKRKPSKVLTIASLACAIHCLSAPLIVVALPFLGHSFHNHYLEVGLLAFSIAMGIWIIYQGYCAHKRRHAAVVFFAGVLFWLAHTISELMHLHIAEEVFVLIGAVFVVASYYLNHKYLKCCPEDHDCSSSHSH